MSPGQPGADEGGEQAVCGDGDNHARPLERRRLREQESQPGRSRRTDAQLGPGSRSRCRALVELPFHIQMLSYRIDPGINAVLTALK
jgi:hypothetical protein